VASARTVERDRPAVVLPPRGITAGVTVVAALVVVLIWGGVGTGAVLSSLDPSVDQRVAAGRSAELVTAARLISTVGQPAVMIGLLVAVVATLAVRARAWTPVLLGAGVIVLLGLFDNLVKVVVARPRPPAAWQAATAHGYSFPSGHALWSAGVLAVLVLLVPWRRVLAVAATLAAVAVGASRVVLAVHYPSDVLAGWCLAVLAVGITVLIATAAAGHRHDPSPPAQQPHVTSGDEGPT
jgi:membrane-associated phospholipid phosphatase